MWPSMSDADFLKRLKNPIGLAPNSLFKLQGDTDWRLPNGDIAHIQPTSVSGYCVFTWKNGASGSGTGTWSVENGDDHCAGGGHCDYPTDNTGWMPEGMTVSKPCI